MNVKAAGAYSYHSALKGYASMMILITTTTSRQYCLYDSYSLDGTPRQPLGFHTNFPAHNTTTRKSPYSSGRSVGPTHVSN
jgi:hypothetical protein